MICDVVVRLFASFFSPRAWPRAFAQYPWSAAIYSPPPRELILLNNNTRYGFNKPPVTSGAPPSYVSSYFVIKVKTPLSSTTINRILPSRRRHVKAGPGLASLLRRSVRVEMPLLRMARKGRIGTFVTPSRKGTSFSPRTSRAATGRGWKPRSGIKIGQAVKIALTSEWMLGSDDGTRSLDLDSPLRDRAADQQLNAGVMNALLLTMINIYDPEQLGDETRDAGWATRPHDVYAVLAVGSIVFFMSGIFCAFNAYLVISCLSSDEEARLFLRRGEARLKAAKMCLVFGVGVHMHAMLWRVFTVLPWNGSCIVFLGACTLLPASESWRPWPLL